MNLNEILQEREAKLLQIVKKEFPLAKELFFITIGRTSVFFMDDEHYSIRVSAKDIKFIKSFTTDKEK